MIDFTLTTYKGLLTALKSAGYTFQTFQDFLKAAPADRVVVLRHDIDKLPANALKMARLEHDLGVAASYYFRVVPGVWDPGVMEHITALGHELGYHYEDLAIAKGDFSKAMAHRGRPSVRGYDHARRGEPPGHGPAVRSAAHTG